MSFFAVDYGVLFFYVLRAFANQVRWLLGLVKFFGVLGFVD